MGFPDPVCVDTTLDISPPQLQVPTQPQEPLTEANGFAPQFETTCGHTTVMPRPDSAQLV